ncbi:MAG: cytochrome b N-terminal domain-containing protein [Chloroflexota bacterium]
MFRRTGAWLDERLGIFQLSRGFLDRHVPGNIGWFHTLGSATLVLILVQIATGIALTMAYVPTPDHAYESILYIDQTPFGGLVRGIHHWSAGLLVLLIGLHILRVFVWGAYRYPRELAWVGGALLFFLVLGFGFTGYLLPWDQKAYWATVVGTNIAGSAPIIGGAVLELLRGGQQLGALTLSRFYGIHIWVLPATLFLVLGFHLFGVVRQGIAASPRRTSLITREPGESRRSWYEREYAAEKAAGKPFWKALFKDALVGLVVVAIVTLVAGVAGAPLEPRADPNGIYTPRPEWYFLDLFQLLWYFGGTYEPLIIFVLFTIGAFVFALVPFLDRGKARHPRRRPFAMAAATIAVVGVLGLTAMGLFGSPSGAAKVPPREGFTAQQLAGLAVFNAQGCTACHTIDGVGGTGGPGLSRAGFRWDEAAIRRQIVTPKDTDMPSYAKLSQQELDDLVAFLVSLQ